MFSKDILIIGFGAQAKAWALNLRDSGRSVDIGLRATSTSTEIAQKMGFTYLDTTSKRICDYKFICLLIPDDQHSKCLKSMAPNLQQEQNIIYAHGFSVHYQELNAIYPKQNHLLLAPKAIASEVRYNYETSGKLIAATSSDLAPHEEDNLLRLSQDLGVNIGPLKSSFKEETEADLFSEQSILCSVIPYAARASFEKLVKEGISREIAYIECWHEVKLIANAMLSVGPEGFFDLISPNALLGGIKAKDQLINSNYLKILDLLFDDITTGKFFQETMNTNFQSVKSEVLNDWGKHPLQQTYDDLGLKLRPKK